MLELFLELVTAREGHLRLESGHHSETWLDLDALFAEPARVWPLVDALAEKIRKHDVDVVCGPLVGGAFLAQQIANMIDADFAFTERHLHDDCGPLYAAEYRLPAAFGSRLSGRRVAIVDDVMSAGSAVIGTLQSLEASGASVVVAGALVILGTRGADLLAQRDIALEAVAARPFNVWLPAECPLCASGTPMERAP
jgi:orotate phosphoribosyltransferase